MTALESSKARQQKDSANLVLSFALAAAGVLILPVGDAIAKYLGTIDYHVFQIAWGRWMSHLVLLTPIVLWRFGPYRLRPEQVKLQILRALLLTTATVSYFFALRTIPIADAAAILFFAPLVVTALSGLLLGEKVGMRRWMAVIIGFFGMLLIVRPDPAEFDWGAGFALIATISFAFYFLLTRKTAGRTPPLITLWFMGVVGAIAITPLAVPVWRAPDLDGWLWMTAIGAVMAVGHLFIIRALDHLEASVVAPLPYLELITATVIGYFWFGDFPGLLTWIGCAIVIGAGLFVITRERKAARGPT